MTSSRHQRFYQALDKLVTEEGLSTRVANDVLYMRNQPHHTVALERSFIQESQKGEVPDVRTFGVQTPS